MPITSLLDTDLYKLTMQQAVLHQFPSVHVEYKFAVRNYFHNELNRIKSEVQNGIDLLGDLRFRESELQFLSELRFMKPDYIDFLRLFRLNRDHVKLEVTNKGFQLRIFGPWLHTILWEVPLLAWINESFCKQSQVPDEGVENLEKKIRLLKKAPEGFKITDFGTRRRYSSDWHRHVVAMLDNTGRLTGTSNVLLAKDLALTPIGTMAHEWLQAGQALTRVQDSQKFMLDAWVKEYRGDLGIALTDVIGIDAFLRDFDLYFMKLFDGVRHDSGDPYLFAEKVIAHYQLNRIDPRTKTAVFSDSLDIPKAIDLYKKYHSRIKMGFGIGTNLTNDVGLKVPNIVIKMVKCNWCPVAKISDSPGKNMCEDPVYIRYLKKAFEDKKPKWL